MLLVLSVVLNFFLLFALTYSTKYKSQSPSVEADVSLAQQRNVLIAQHLDELFDRITTNVEQDNAAEKSWKDLLLVFANYDSRFVEQNVGDPGAVAETAYAAHRAAESWLLLEETQNSLHQLRQAKRSMQQLIRDQPERQEYRIESFEIQLALIGIELDEGNVEIAHAEFESAIRMIRDWTGPSGSDSQAQRLTYIQQLKHLATLGMELQRIQDTFFIAQYFDQHAQKLMSDFPENEAAVRESNDSRMLIRGLSSLIQRTSDGRP